MRIIVFGGFLRRLVSRLLWIRHLSRCILWLLLLLDRLHWHSNCLVFLFVVVAHHLVHKPFNLVMVASNMVIVSTNSVIVSSDAGVARNNFVVVSGQINLLSLDCVVVSNYVIIAAVDLGVVCHQSCIAHSYCLVIVGVDLPWCIYHNRLWCTVYWRLHMVVVVVVIVVMTTAVTVV
jgi:hypothetical protein